MSPEDKMEMLKWLSIRNAHMATYDLAFLLGISVDEPDEDTDDESRAPLQ